MSRKARIVRRLVGTAFVAAVASTTLVGLATTGQAQAVAVTAKCIPGTGNPLNPCPWP